MEFKESEQERMLKNYNKYLEMEISNDEERRSFIDKNEGKKNE